jgi:tripeptidyl-peptidase I
MIRYNLVNFSSLDAITFSQSMMKKVLPIWSKLFVWYIAIILLVVSMATHHVGHVLMDKTVPATYEGYTSTERTDGATVIELVFHVKPASEEKLLEALMAASDPTSPSYGKHLSKAEVDKLSHNPAGLKETTSFLESIPGITFSSHGDPSVINASAPVASWETALHAQFLNFKKDTETETFVRTHEFYLPENVAPHIVAVFNTVQFPMMLRPGPVIRRTGFA